VRRVSAYGAPVCVRTSGHEQKSNRIPAVSASAVPMRTGTAAVPRVFAAFLRRDFAGCAGGFLPFPPSAFRVPTRTVRSIVADHRGIIVAGPRLLRLAFTRLISKRERDRDADRDAESRSVDNQRFPRLVRVAF